MKGSDEQGSYTKLHSYKERIIDCKSKQALLGAVEMGIRLVLDSGGT
jgi:hypothetical protein